MATKIEVLRAEFNAVTTKFNAGLKKAEKRFRQFRDRMKKFAKRVSSVLKPVGLAIAAIATAVTVALAVIITKTARIGDEFDKMAKRTGLAVEALSELKFAANLSGTSLASIETAAKRLARAAADYQDSLERVRAAVSGVTRAIGLALIPELTGLADKTAVWIAANRELIGLKADELVGKLVTAGKELSQWWDSNGQRVIVDMTLNIEKLAKALDLLTLPVKFFDELGRVILRGAGFSDEDIALSEQLAAQGVSLGIGDALRSVLPESVRLELQNMGLLGRGPTARERGVNRQRPPIITGGKEDVRASARELVESTDFLGKGLDENAESADTATTALDALAGAANRAADATEKAAADGPFADLDKIQAEERKRRAAGRFAPGDEPGLRRPGFGDVSFPPITPTLIDAFLTRAAQAAQAATARLADGFDPRFAAFGGFGGGRKTEREEAAAQAMLDAGMLMLEAAQTMEDTADRTSGRSRGRGIGSFPVESFISFAQQVNAMNRAFDPFTRTVATPVVNVGSFPV